MTDVTNDQAREERVIILRFPLLTDGERRVLPPADDLTVKSHGALRAIGALLFANATPPEFCVAPCNLDADGWCGHAPWHHERGVCLGCAAVDAETVRASILTPGIAERILFVHEFQPGHRCPTPHVGEWDGTSEASCGTCNMLGVVRSDGSAIVPEGHFGTERAA